MNTSYNNFDSIESLIYTNNIRIVSVDFHPDMDLMLILLNTKSILKSKISASKILKEAPLKDLLKYKLIAGCTGITWPKLYEDLSLKYFLKEELASAINVVGYAA